MTYVLYASGKLLEAADQSVAVQAMAQLSDRTPAQIEARLLSGERKKVKSAESIDKLLKLEIKLRALGFDVFIEET